MTTRRVVTDLIVLLLFATGGQTVMSADEPLPDGSVAIMNLTEYNVYQAFTERTTFEPNSNLTISVVDIPLDVSFIILQVHTYQYNVTLSYDEMHLHKISNQSIFGSNLGLYVVPDSKFTAQVYLRNDNVHKVDALLVAIGYGNDAPIPGGCNMEFDIEIAPYQKLYVNHAMVSVDFQSASMPLTKGAQPSCEKHPLEHNMYHIYLSEQDFSVESYFTAISRMLTVHDILENGYKIPPPIMASSMRRVFSAYPGTGSVYAAVAIYGNRSSAYVPAFTYACSPLLYPETCQNLNDTVSGLFCGILFFMGFFSVFLGHRYVRVDMILPISLCGGILGYAMSMAGGNNSTTNLLIGLIVAVIATLLWFSIWCCSRRAVFTALVSNLTCGFFWSSIAYYNFPDDSTAMENNWIFWTVFLVITLLCSVVLSVIPPYFCNAVTCAIYGSYMMVIPIDYFAGSSLKYIFINVIRRLAVPGFNMAVIHAPCQVKDICLSVLWALLATIRMVRQYCGNVNILSKYNPL